MAEVLEVESALSVADLESVAVGGDFRNHTLDLLVLGTTQRGYSKRTNHVTPSLNAPESRNWRSREEPAHLSREVLVDEVEGGLVDRLILVGLEGLDAVQTTALLHHQAQLLRLTDLIPGLERNHRTQ